MTRTEINLPGNTVLKGNHNKPIAEKLNIPQYIFEFVNAYDFSGEGSKEIQEERKTPINASVLALIFERNMHLFLNNTCNFYFRFQNHLIIL